MITEESSSPANPRVAPWMYSCSAAAATGVDSPTDFAAAVTSPMSLTKMSRRLRTSTLWA